MPDTSTARDHAAAYHPLRVILDRDPLVLAPETPCGEAVSRLVARPGALRVEACLADAEGRYVGLVSLRDCLAAPAEKPVEDLARRDVAVFDPEDPAERAAIVIEEEGLDLLPVVDADGRLRGAVHADEARAWLIAELKEDADLFTGITGSTTDDYLEHSVWSDFRRRFPWVLGLAIAGLAAGYVVHVYEDALDALVILALYMPMVADTGGNVGTQSASLVTRALTVGDLRLTDSARILWRETRVALLMAAMLFIFAYLKVSLISNAADAPDGLSLELIGFAIAVALATQVVSATIIGALLPLGAVATRQDPAVVSGPALTTIVDLTGLLLYFSLTTWILGIGAGPL